MNWGASPLAVAWKYTGAPAVSTAIATSAISNRFFMTLIKRGSRGGAMARL